MRDLSEDVNAHLTNLTPAADSGEGAILPTWTAVDTGNVKTSRELWEHMKKQGWNVDVRLVIIFDSASTSDSKSSFISITGPY
jgi:hypothetical protein